MFLFDCWLLACQQPLCELCCAQSTHSWGSFHISSSFLLYSVQHETFAGPIKKYIFIYIYKLSTFWLLLYCSREEGCAKDHFITAPSFIVVIALDLLNSVVSEKGFSSLNVARADEQLYII